MADKFNVTSRAKSVLGYTGAGIAYVFVAGLILGLIANSVGIDTMIGLQAFGQSFANFDVLGIVLGIISFLILGFLVWVFAIVGIKIRRALGSKEQEISFSKRPFILALFLTGIVTAVVFYGLNEILAGLSPDANLTDVSTLLSAITTFNPMLLIGTILGLAVVGYLVIKIGRYIPKIGDYVPDPLKK